MKLANTTDQPPFVISAQLAKPLANPWRNRILMELHLRPMSPKQFAREFDGPELATIARYFRELREWGFLEVVEEIRGGRRRGAVEKVHRAIQRVHFDTPTWERLPSYLRAECSGSVLDGLLLRISQSVQARTFDAETDRHLSWKALSLDRQAWTEYVTQLDEVLTWITTLEAESSHRLAQSGEEPIPTTVALLAFRSPTKPIKVPKQGSVQQVADTDLSPPGPHFLISPKTAKALADPWRSRILMELHLQPMSPRGFTEKFGGPELATIARYFRQLRDWGYIDVVEELRGGHRRGSVEKVYQATKRVHFHTSTWEDLPSNLRCECSGSVLDSLILRIHEAVVAETFDAETDRHLSWKAISLDRQAWTECVTCLDETLDYLYELENESAVRMATEGTGEIPATVAHLAFRSPRLPTSPD